MVVGGAERKEGSGIAGWPQRSGLGNAGEDGKAKIPSGFISSLSEVSSVCLFAYVCCNLKFVVCVLVCVCVCVCVCVSACVRACSCCVRELIAVPIAMYHTLSHHQQRQDASATTPTCSSPMLLSSDEDKKC